MAWEACEMKLQELHKMQTIQARFEKSSFRHVIRCYRAVTLMLVAKHEHINEVRMVAM